MQKGNVLQNVDQIHRQERHLCQVPGNTVWSHVACEIT